jgi:hypothetical protein
MGFEAVTEWEVHFNSTQTATSVLLIRLYRFIFQLLIRSSVYDLKFVAECKPACLWLLSTLVPGGFAALAYPPAKFIVPPFT